MEMALVYFIAAIYTTLLIGLANMMGNFSYYEKRWYWEEFVVPTWCCMWSILVGTYYIGKLLLISLCGG